MSLSLRTCLTLASAAVISSAMSSQVVFGQAEQSLQNQLLRVRQQRQTSGTGPDSATPEGPAHGRADAWAVRASEAKRRNEPIARDARSAIYGGPGKCWSV